MPKTVLITGAGSGFGRGAALELAQRGHKVIAGVLDDRQAKELARAAPKLTVARLDITDAKDIAKVDKWNLDVFVANAALGQTGPLSLIPLERLRAVFEVNVFGTFAITQRVAQAMRKRRAGRIIVTSSIGGVRRRGERATLDAENAGVLRDGDVVVMLGRAEAVDAAESVLLRG